MLFTKREHTITKLSQSHHQFPRPLLGTHGTMALKERHAFLDSGFLTEAQVKTKNIQGTTPLTK